MSDERGKPHVISCAARNVAVYAAINPWRCKFFYPTFNSSPKQGEAYSHNSLITGSEKQARQGERGFDRRERT